MGPVKLKKNIRVRLGRCRWRYLTIVQKDMKKNHRSGEVDEVATEHCGI